ncbi:FecCD family ABC transporter permease [Frankia tisae]|uniref:FecCD family ABC transporter permease n=1 Tax=Frankia tisae TaxID=2950104 RepID=UPI0021C1725C|nr:iron chelate uptake ABC transporter family permease subunit [Frankia tisae]
MTAPPDAAAPAAGSEFASELAPGSGSHFGSGYRSGSGSGYRTAMYCLILVVLTVATAILALTTGEFHVPVGEVVRSLTGRGSPSTHFIVVDLRLPRVLCAILAGAAFGASGAIFQSLTRNPLGSPDIVGFETGAASGALIAIILLHGGPGQATLGALVGSLATAALVYLLSLQGGATPHRLVLTGIGVNTMLVALNAYLIAHADFQDALAAQVWRIGDLAGRGWSDVVAVDILLGVALPLALLLSRSLSMLALGDDTAIALGVPVQRRHLELLGVAVMLAAAGTVAAGPVAFIALAAPQVALRMTCSQGPAIAASACTGALLLALSDFAAQRLLAPTVLPVGAATGVLGGLYLAGLLATSRQRS